MAHVSLSELSTFILTLASFKAVSEILTLLPAAVLKPVKLDGSVMVASTFPGI